MKRILVYAGGGLFPVRGMNQVRILNQIKSLSEDHIVDFMFLYSKEQQKLETITGLKDYCNEVLPLQSFTQRMGFKVLKKLFLAKLFEKLANPLDYYILSNVRTSKLIANQIKKRNYNIIISHYWQASGFFRYLPKHLIKCIDTHYVVEENIELFKQGKYNHINHKKFGALLEKEFNLQNKYFDLSELLVVNSKKQEEILKEFGRKNIITIPNGQDLTKYLNYEKNSDEGLKTVLFYGALSNQFNLKAIKIILENIWPKISEKHNNINLKIVGSNPPKWLIEKANQNKSIEVTGFVNDVRPIFSQSIFALLPLDSASGFRGRTIELMASGVPIIGTNNALLSVNIKHEKNGVIADTVEEFLFFSLRLIEDESFRNRISNEGKEFVKENYTLEATFGKLSSYLMTTNWINKEL